MELTAEQCALIAQLAPLLFIALIAERRVLGPVRAVQSSVFLDMAASMLLFLAAVAGVIGATDGLIGLGAIAAAASILAPAVWIVAGALAFDLENNREHPDD